MKVSSVTAPTTILELEGYFHYHSWHLYFSHTPIDLLYFDNERGIHIDFVHDDRCQYQMLIERKRYDTWEVVLDKIAYWWFCNGVWISENPIRHADGSCTQPQVRINFGFDTDVIYKLKWVQMP